AIADDERCGPVQRRFHALVTAKLAAAERQVGELPAVSGQLRAAPATLAAAGRQVAELPASSGRRRAAAVALGGQPVDGPCDADCACLMATPPDHPDIACTLTIGDRPARQDDSRTTLAPARPWPPPVRAPPSPEAACESSSTRRSRSSAWPSWWRPSRAAGPSTRSP